MTFPKKIIEWAPGELDEYRKLAEGGETMRRLAKRKGCTHVSMRAAITGVPARERRGTREILTNEQREEARRAIAAGEDMNAVAKRYGRSWAWAYWVGAGPQKQGRVWLVTYATTKAKPCLWPLVTTGKFRPVSVVEGEAADAALKKRRETEGEKRFSILVKGIIPENMKQALDEKSDA